MPFTRVAVDTPFGFRPYNNSRTSPYRKRAGAPAMYPGDLVGQLTDGTVDVITSTASPVLGVAVGYSAASTAETVLIHDDPSALFFAQDDGDTSAMTALSEGANADPIITTGSTTTFQGQQEIDSSSAGATTAMLHILRLHECEGGSYASAAGSPRRWVVSINPRFHQLASTSGI